MRSSLLLCAVLSTASAFPHGISVPSFNLIPKWAHGQQGSDDPNACSLANAQQPVDTPTAMIAPTGTLSLVAIGRGTQNYTCATADASSAPVSDGALATLYDVSCIAAENPQMLAQLPAKVLSISQADAQQRFGWGIAGHHFFDSAKVPVFSLNGLGLAHAKKVQANPAPAADAADGAVPWLYLTSVETPVGKIKEMYRLETAGGAAPKDCSSMKVGVNTVEYAAEYWFYT
jgi:hypothetical protein